MTGVLLPVIIMEKQFYFYEYKGFYFRILTSFYMSCIYLPHTLPQSEESLDEAPVLSGPLSNKIYILTI